MAGEALTGQVGVQLAAAALLKAGWQVAVPLVDTGHDLLAHDSPESYLRIQVKSHSGSNRQKLVRLQRSEQGAKVGYREGMVDAVAVCNIAIGDVKFIPFASASGKTCVSFSSPLLVEAEGLRDAMESLH